MKVESAVQMMGVIQSQYDGTELSAQRVKHLTKVLLENPETFWDEYWSTVTADEDDPIRKQAEAMIRSGTIDDTTTFSQLRKILQDAQGHRKQI